MTLASERIKESHRGSRRAEPASRSRLAALDTFRLRYVRVDDFNVIVEGTYQLNLAMSYWRSEDGTSQGYLVSTLDAEIKRQRKSRNPVADRDSIAADRTANLEPDAAIAESVTGTDPTDSETALLLPVVSP